VRQEHSPNKMSQNSHNPAKKSRTDTGSAQPRKLAPANAPSSAPNKLGPGQGATYDTMNAIHPPTSLPPVPYGDTHRPPYVKSRSDNFSRMSNEQVSRSPFQGRTANQDDTNMTHQKSSMLSRMDRIEAAVDGYIKTRGEQALSKSQLPK
jgi:hypothetical protein